jgi:hypothetical protein
MHPLISDQREKRCRRPYARRVSRPGTSLRAHPENGLDQIKPRDAVARLTELVEPGSVCSKGRACRSPPVEFNQHIFTSRRGACGAVVSAWPSVMGITTRSGTFISTNGYNTKPESPLPGDGEGVLSLSPFRGDGPSEPRPILLDLVLQLSSWHRIRVEPLSPHHSGGAACPAPLLTVGVPTRIPPPPETIWSPHCVAALRLSNAIKQ